MNTLKLVLINLIIALVILLAMELGLRFFHPDINLQSTARELVIPNKYGSSFGLKENAKGESFGIEIESDNFGLRKSTVPALIDSSSILLLGDSVTMGVGVESDSTFAGLLARDLYSKGQGAINFSLIGYNILDYINTYKFAMENYEFGNSILFYCLNDYGTIESGGIRDSRFFGSLIYFLKSNSYLYAWIKNTFADRQRASFEYEQSIYSDQKTLDSLKNRFGRLKNLSIDNSPIVVILPYEYQLRSNIPDLSIQKKIKKLLDDHNIKYYDPFLYLKNLNLPSEELYLYADGLHFSKLGHKYVYEFISENILQKPN